MLQNFPGCAPNLIAKAKGSRKTRRVKGPDGSRRKELLSFGPPRGGGSPPVSNAKGSVKFWLKEGALQKYEFKVKGLINFGGNEVDVDRATTVEIKEVGTTKVEVPEDAKKKLS